MTVMEGIRDYLSACPYLAKGALRVDYLGDRPTEYTVEAVPSDRVVTQYADGGTLREFLFLFASREEYGSDVLQNLENSGFYEQFSDWLSAQDQAGRFPVLPEGKEPQRIETLSGGYLLDAQEHSARYQIQCRLLYYQKG